MKNKICTVILGVAVAVMILTFSIGLPIYFRPFYYWQIEPLDIPFYTDKTVEEIRAGYDEVLDYLTLPGGEFGAGSFAFSEEGAAHFADCKVLFNLNFFAFLISSAAVILLVILARRGRVALWRPFGLDIPFFSGAGVLGAFLLIGAVVAADFDTAFAVFHAIFFPGKDNWLFDPATDEIIGAMPEEFFMNCAILIVSSIIIISLTLMVISIVRKHKTKKTVE
ncbi:MAG: TIGR01906 family membrane protein [Clostridia bacterium]|nr:TIGR01906 family membrane protein [Clostridia bacterium]